MHVKVRRKKILQGLGVGPGSVTERWPFRKSVRKSVFFGPGGLRATHVVADEAKLAIVFTYLFSFFFLLFLGNIFFFYEKKLIFARSFGTASVRSQDLDQPLVPGVFL